MKNSTLLNVKLVKPTLLMLFTVCVVFVFLSAEDASDYSAVDEHYFRSSGAANAFSQGYTGAPGDSGTCANCHGGGGGTTTETLEIRDSGGNLITEYTPGETYDVSLTVNNSGGLSQYGFQMTSLRGSDNTDIGSWQNITSANTDVVAANSRNYVEHTSRLSTSNVFTGEWVAPATSTGNVTFYYIGNAVNANGGTSGDRPGAGSSMTLSEVVLSTTDLQFEEQITLFKNNTNQLQIEGLQSAKAKLQLYDLLGKKMMDVDFDSADINVLDLPSLTTGVYIVNLSTDEGRLSRKVIL